MTAQKIKPHREFFKINVDALSNQVSSWVTVPDTQGMIEEQILADNLDPVKKTGSRTRIARWKPGALIAKEVIHDFYEEVFIAQGSLMVGCDAQGLGGEEFPAFTFACRPPEIFHGPFISHEGCIMLEFQYYDSIITEQPKPSTQNDLV